MDLIEFLNIESFIKNIPSNLVDFTDRFVFIYTPVIFIFSSSILIMKHFVFKPILCTVPYEFNTTWDEFVQNYCWIQPTYILLQDGSFPPNKQKKYFQTNYYQWVPFVFLLQAGLNFIPYLIWKKISNHCGVEMMRKMENLKLKLTKTYVTKQNLLDISQEMSNSIIPLLENHLTDYYVYFPKKNQCGKLKSLIRNSILYKYFNKRTGNMLVAYYIIIKLAFTLVSVLQIWIMKIFLGTVKLSFGYDILMNNIRRDKWQITQLFPRIVGCDLNILQTGQSANYSFLCALPVNMINEKLYIFLWFWMIFCMTSTILSIWSWCSKLYFVQARQRFVEKLLTIQKVLDPKNMHIFKNQSSLKSFTENFLKLDGIFILRMLSLSSSLYFTSFVCNSIWEKYQENENDFSKSNSKDCL